MVAEVGLRSNVLELKVLLILIPERPSKRLLGRLTQGNRQNVINLLQALVLLRSQLLDRPAQGSHTTQDNSMIAQFGNDQGVKLARGRGGERFGVEGFGDDTVALDEVDEHVPLSAVVDGFFEEVLDYPVVHVPVAQVDHALQEPYYFLFRLRPRALVLHLLSSGNPVHVFVCTKITRCPIFQSNLKTHPIATNTLKKADSRRKKEKKNLQLDFSNLSQKNRYPCESSNSSRLYFFMTSTRKTFNAAKIQQRPDDFWLVTMDSIGILVLKTWLSAIMTSRLVIRVVKSTECAAFWTILFLGSALNDSLFG